jgi:hypothetical protein
MTADTHSRIAPEPIEAPEPQPVRQTRQRDLVRDHALAWGWRVMTADGPGPTVAAFRAGVDAYEMYRRVHDRRDPSALGDVL